MAFGRSTKELIALAKLNRRSATTAEEFLWSLLRRKQMEGRTFRRQHPLGRFIADFYCDDARLVIELDGAHHQETSQAERDAEREAIIAANDLTVLRFTNDETLNQTEQVLDAISEFILTHSHTAKNDGTMDTPLTPPSPTAWGRGAEGERVRETSQITALEPQQKREGRVNIYLNGTFALGVAEEVIVALGLRVGMNITPERLAEVTDAETRSRAREAAYHLLSYRPRSESEISERLLRKGYEADVVAETQAHLREVGYLNDESFARIWVEERGRTRGRAALGWELRKKGVDSETAAAALSNGLEPEAEREAARRMAVGKVGERPADVSPAARARLASSLARRGFGWDCIRPVLAELYGRGREEGEE